MELLYSNIRPMQRQDKTIVECIKENMAKSDRVEIAVGYVSIASLNELDALVSGCNVGRICLNIGMYNAEGMPKRLYLAASMLNRKWMAAGMGEIRLIKPFRYHGKLYCFYKNGTPFAAVIGSANLSILKPATAEQRTYEISALTTDRNEAAKIASHMEELKNGAISENIGLVKGWKFLLERNGAFDVERRVSRVSESEIKACEASSSSLSFLLKLKVPKAAERYLDDTKHYTKSNINVCYAEPRSSSKPRDWYEMQLTVGVDVTRRPGYPKKNEPFFVITDDGYKFKAHTTSSGNKQFSAVGDELIMGRWIKGRLLTAGIATYVPDTGKDKTRKGMITQEMLQEYGCDAVEFKKTGIKLPDEDGNPLDVWLLSFVPSADR